METQLEIESMNKKLSYSLGEFLYEKFKAPIDNQLIWLSLKFLCFEQTRKFPDNYYRIHFGSNLDGISWRLVDLAIEEWRDTVSSFLVDNIVVDIVHYDPCVNMWPLIMGPWKETYIFNATPVLVLCQYEDGRVEGFSAIDPHAGSSYQQVMKEFKNFKKVTKLISSISEDDSDVNYEPFALINPEMLIAENLDTAISNTKKSRFGQKYLLVFDVKANNWKNGIWNDPEVDEFGLGGINFND